jgi:hypothetical protein
MLAVAFDTLKLARKLENAGMQPKLAQETSAALSESFTEWLSVGNIATREDVQESKYDILKWMFAQTLVLLGSLFGMVALVAHLLGK